MTVIWGQNDYIFPAEGAYPYKHHLKDVEFHLFDTGHFALEEEGDAIADHSRISARSHVSIFETAFRVVGDCHSTIVAIN